VERIQERQLLHQLLRVGMGRADDLRLLQRVAAGEHELAREAAAVQRLMLECEYREEWRVQRETQLQEAVCSFTFASCSDGTTHTHGGLTRLWQP